MITIVNQTDTEATFSIESWDGNTYTLKLKRIGRYREAGGEYVSYSFYRPGSTRPLFSGSDFGTSPMHDVLSVESAVGLLGFLTLQPGDTDDDYFASYKPAQLAWAESYECERLSGVVHHFEESQRP